MVFGRGDQVDCFAAFGEAPLRVEVGVLSHPLGDGVVHRCATVEEGADPGEAIAAVGGGDDVFDHCWGEKCVIGSGVLEDVD